MAIDIKCLQLCGLLTLVIRLSHQQMENQDSQEVGSNTDSITNEIEWKYIWNKYDPKTFAFLRICGPYGSYEVQPISYCSKGVIFKNPIIPYCVCPFGVWILKASLCDSTTYILVGDGRKNVCYTVDFKIRSILYLGDPEDVRVSKAYVGSHTMSVFHEIPQNGSWTTVLGFDHPVIIAIFPIGAIETEEGSCFPLKEYNKYDAPVHIWSAAIRPTRFRVVKKCTDEYNFSYDDLAGPYNVYIRSNNLPSTIPHVECEHNSSECLNMASTTIRPINPIHVSTTLTPDKNGTLPTTTKKSSKSLFERPRGEIEAFLLKNPIEVIVASEWKENHNSYEYVDEDISEESAKAQGLFNSDGSINSKAAFWSDTETKTFRLQTTERSGSPGVTKQAGRGATSRKSQDKKGVNPKTKQLSTTVTAITTQKMGRTIEFTTRPSVPLIEEFKGKEVKNETDTKSDASLVTTTSMAELVPSINTNSCRLVYVLRPQTCLRKSAVNPGFYRNTSRYSELKTGAMGLRENKSLPYHFMEYLKTSASIFAKACPTIFTINYNQKYLPAALSIFRTIPKKADKVYKTIMNATHQSNFNVLRDCLRDTIPFTFHYYTKCPFKIGCGSLRSTREHKITELKPDIPESIAFNVSLNISIETVWKVVLFSKYHCAKYFVIRDKLNDMKILYNYLDNIFTEKAVRKRWYGNSTLEREIIEEVFGIRDLDEFIEKIDSCLGLGKHLSEISEWTEYLPGDLMEWTERPTNYPNSTGGSTNNEVAASLNIISDLETTTKTDIISSTTEDASNTIISTNNVTENNGPTDQGVEITTNLSNMDNTNTTTYTDSQKLGEATGFNQSETDSAEDVSKTENGNSSVTEATKENVTDKEETLAELTLAPSSKETSLINSQEQAEVDFLNEEEEASQMKANIFVGEDTTLSPKSEKSPGEVSESPANPKETEHNTTAVPSVSSENDDDGNDTDSVHRTMTRRIRREIKELTVIPIYSNSLIKVELPNQNGVEICNFPTSNTPPDCQKEGDFALDDEQEKEYSRLIILMEKVALRENSSVYEKYIITAKDIFSTLCPTKLLSDISINRLLSLFKTLIPENSEINYNSISAEVHRSNFKILEECIQDTKPITLHYSRDCPLKVLCGSINNTDEDKLKTAVPNSIAFDTTSLDISIESAWKLVLLLKYHCGKYFAKNGKVNDMDELYSFLDKLFINPSILSKWYKPINLPRSALAKLLSTEGLEFIHVFDSCISIAKRLSEKHQPEIVQEWDHRPTNYRKRKRRDFPSDKDIPSVWDDTGYCIGSFWEPLQLFDMTTYEKSCYKKQ